MPLPANSLLPTSLNGTSLLAPHHDGSERYVADRAPAIGATVAVFVRVPHAAHAERVFLRSIIDGEPRWAQAVVDRADARETWWRADLTIANPVNRYRFLLEGGAAPYRWVNAAGVIHRDTTDANDFWLTTFDPPPAWLEEAVVYQVFPDRFAPSAMPHHWPDWAVRSEWADPVAPDWPTSTRQLFGGDLVGLREHLDHITGLGANAIYLTPFFTAESAHRYNANTFDHVDPMLGGDAAMVQLMDAAHRAGVRVIGDLTTNHTGNHHDWFRTAQRDRGSTEAGFYFFEGDDPDDYVGWFGVKTLPKLDHRAAALAERMLVGPGSITGKWLSPPYELDGWRIDVANMTGRYRDIDTNHAVARAMRATMADVRPDGWLVAEHCYDASSDLVGDGWHGTMNYSGFARPVWSWLSEPEPRIGLMGFPSPPPRIGGTDMAGTMTDFMAALPWRSNTASMTLLGSHDTARWRSVAGDPGRQMAGLGLLMAFPGVPTVYYGDEVGVTGINSDLGRAPMPWNPTQWDQRTLAGYRSLIGVRRGSSALQRGGLRWVHTGDDCVALLRESADETVLVQVSRAAHEPITLDAQALGLHSPAATLHGDRALEPTNGSVTLTGDGPAVHIWRLDP
ncbi:MAG: glycoside hydrolase family 13 protein [Actinomycetota bacterium]|nr:glycoside hydrolase family 13 protein [Actinomycetota bacterium]